MTRANRGVLLLLLALASGDVWGEVVRHRGQRQECLNGRCVLVNGYATAFSIANSGGSSYWLTVAHGVPEMPTQWLEVRGKRYECSTIKRRKDQLYDYALLRAPGLIAQEVYCLPVKQQVGAVSVTGFPATSTVPTTLQTRFYQGSVFVGPQRMYTVEGTFVRGWSGSPALVADRNGQKYALGVLCMSDGQCTPTAYIRREIAQYVPGGFQCEVAPPPPQEIPDAPLPKIPECECKPTGDAKVAQLEKRIDALAKQLEKHQADTNKNLVTITTAVEANSKWIAIDGKRSADVADAVDDLERRLKTIEDYRRKVEMVAPSGEVYSAREYGWDEPIKLYGVMRSKADSK